MTDRTELWLHIAKKLNFFQLLTLKSEFNFVLHPIQRRANQHPGASGALAISNVYNADC